MSYAPPVPESFETERLRARAPQPGDGRALNEAVLETWPAVSRWMEWAQGDPPSVADSEANCHAARQAFDARTELRYHLYEKCSGRFVGVISLHTIDWGVPVFEVGYWCRQSEQGKGYATEALRGITVVCFESLNAVRVEVRCDPRNEASRSVARRAGYEMEAVLRNNARSPDGELRDTMVFALVQTEFAEWASRYAWKGKD